MCSLFKLIESSSSLQKIPNFLADFDLVIRPLWADTVSSAENRFIDARRWSAGKKWYSAFICNYYCQNSLFRLWEYAKFRNPQDTLCIMYWNPAFCNWDHAWFRLFFRLNFFSAFPNVAKHARNGDDWGQLIFAMDIWTRTCQAWLECLLLWRKRENTTQMETMVRNIGSCLLTSPNMHKMCESICVHVIHFTEVDSSR